MQQRGVARPALLVLRELLAERRLLAERVVDAPADEARLARRQHREVQGTCEHVAFRLLTVEPVAEPRLDVVGLELVVPALLPQLVDRGLRVDDERVDEPNEAGAPTLGTARTRPWPSGNM